MAYEPETITKLARAYKYLEDKGVSAWYGEAGKDIVLANLILTSNNFKEAYQYCLDYGYATEDEDE